MYRHINFFNMSMFEITGIFLPCEKGIWKGFAIDSNKSGAIDTAKFILDVLKQHRNDLNRLVTKLGHTAAEFKKIDESMDRMQFIVDDLLDSLRKKQSSDE
jgi:hypothetical protein